MVWKSVLFVTGVSAAAVAYWLYTPLPDGYSCESVMKIQMFFAVGKFIHLLAAAGSFLGFGDHLTLTKQISEPMIKRMRVTDPQVQETDLLFDGVPVRLYEPVGRSGVLTGVISYHGGGWISGSLDLGSSIMQRICKETNSVVVSVDYRLAPDFIFPAAFEDCVKATKYFLSNAAKFHVNPHRITVFGQSAGGNLAAAVALKLRDDKFQPVIKMQVLANPITQGLDFMLPSMMQNEDAPMLKRKDMARCVSMYLLGSDDRLKAFQNNEHVSPAVKQMKVPYIDVSQLPSKYLVGYERPSVETGNETMWNELKHKLLNPYFSPLIAQHLNGLPLTYLFTAEHDPLRDEGILYANRLRNSGIKVEYAHSEIGLHGIWALHNMISEADEMFQEVLKFMSDNL